MKNRLWLQNCEVIFLHEKIPNFIFSLILLLSVTACVPPGTETYYFSEYEADSQKFDIQLNVIQSHTPAPKDSTLLIQSKDDNEAEPSDQKAKIFFRVYDGSVQSQLNQTTIIDVDKIPRPLLNGLDFEAVLVYGDYKEEITFHQVDTGRKHFRP
ncbi:hypothetical protein [Saccharibacillus sp. JS10]|uniref:hypothetical protein n=1 Tax=Saccharibacillus sp. JS10 TaxID=2950552 RepID=UPI00210C2AF6|nr:hypothetical protein [Saccharibacillus sp. JS10]MCQ4087806.1 hypothetical protein [Saccharibacillus sp. JS10]